MGKKKNAGAVVGQLGTTARLVRTALAERLLEHGFYAGQDQIMLALGKKGSMTPGELAAEIGIRPPTVTKTLNRLGEQGFIEKQTSETDARRSVVTLTASGSAALAAIGKSVRMTEKAALDGLGKKDRRALRKLLTRIELNLAGTGA